MADASTSAGASRSRARSASVSAGSKRKARPSHDEPVHSSAVSTSAGSAAKKPKSALKKSTSSTSASASTSQNHVTLRLASSLEAGKYGAVLTSSPNFELPDGISFSAEVANTQRNGSSSSSRSQPGSEAALYLCGQDDVMFYHNTNWRPQRAAPTGKRPPADRGYSGQYLVGTRDPATNTMTLHRAPLFTMTRIISELQNLKAIKADGLGQQADWNARVAARRDLGDVFGTRKAKAIVRAQDRLKVDASHMGAMLDEVAEGITESAAILPSVQDITAIEAEGRPGPLPNMGATKPEDVYPPSILVPASVLSALPISRLINAEDEAGLRKALPVLGTSNADWLLTRVSALVKRIKANASHGEGGILRTNREEARIKLRLAFYLALLWAFRKNSRALNDKAVLMGKLRIDHVTNGEIIADDLLSRFAESPRGGGSPVFTTASETKLYTHICALALHLDDFAVDAPELALALALAPAKLVDYFKSIGCTPADVNVPVATPSSNALESASSSLRKERRMVLKIPLKFPQQKRRAPPKGR